MNKHWQQLSQTLIWCPYPITGYMLWNSKAPSLANALSSQKVSQVVQATMRDYLKVTQRHMLFPTRNVTEQGQAVAQLICETLPDAAAGQVTAWVDALRVDELSEINRKDIQIALNIDLNNRTSLD